MYVFHALLNASSDTLNTWGLDLNILARFRQISCKIAQSGADYYHKLHGELHDGVDNVIGVVLQGLHSFPSRDIGLGRESFIWKFN